MPPVGFKPTIAAGEQPNTYALDRAATETGTTSVYQRKNCPHRISVTFIVGRQESEAARMLNTGHVIFLLSNCRVSLH